MLKREMFFDSWEVLLRTLVVGGLAWLALVLMLRISGKRTLAKLNSFDLVVTVALGSTLATILLSRDVALAEGAVAFLVLIGMQFAVAWLSVRSRTVRRLARSEPRLLLFRGEFLETAMNDERVTRSEVLQAIRSNGSQLADNVEGVVLETDGTLSVIPRDRQQDDGSTADRASDPTSALAAARDRDSALAAARRLLGLDEGR